MQGLKDEVCNPRKYFSLSEANALLPRVEYYLSEMARIQRGVNNLYRKASKMGLQFDDDICIDDFDADEPLAVYLKSRIVELSEEYIDYVEKISRLGVELEDADQGIVKMYSWFDGREICLSWQYGEDEIGFWHQVDEDHLARRPLKGEPVRKPVEPVLH